VKNIVGGENFSGIASFQFAGAVVGDGLGEGIGAAAESGWGGGIV
jgi:hypothetical protein